MERDEQVDAPQDQGMEPGCKHRWVLGQPSQGVVQGRCRHCGAERQYPAFLEDYDRGYGSDRSMVSDDLLGTGAGGARPSQLVRGLALRNAEGIALGNAAGHRLSLESES